MSALGTERHILRLHKSANCLGVKVAIVERALAHDVLRAKQNSRGTHKNVPIRKWLFTMSGDGTGLRYQADAMD
jgi:hypothetical protein